MGKDGSDRDGRLALPWAVAPLVVIAGLLAMVAAMRPASALGMRAALLVSEVVLVIPGLLALALARIPLAAGLRLGRIDGRTAGLSVVAGGTLWLASLGLLELQSLLWPPEAGYLELFRRLHEALRPKGPLDALLSIVAIALAPAVCEEVLMRGIVLPSLLPRMGGTAAVATSALLFGAIHLDAYRFPFTVAAGIGLGALRLRTRALLPSVLAHAVLNTITFVAALTLADPTGGGDAGAGLGAALLAGGVAASAAVVWKIGSDRLAS